jgi:cyclic-di-AMP phosphodiesterase PgpH
MFLKKKKMQRIQDNKEKISILQLISKFFKQKENKSLFLGLSIVFVCVSLLLFYNKGEFKLDFKKGLPAKEDIYALTGFSYIDEQLTQDKIDRITDKVYLVYNIDEEISNKIIEELELFFEYLNKKDPDQEQKAFLDNFNIRQGYLTILKQASDNDKTLVSKIKSIIAHILERGIINEDEKYSLTKKKRYYISVINKSLKSESSCFVDDIITLSSVYRVTRDKLRITFKKNVKLRYASEELIENFLKPNLYENISEYEKAKRKLEKSIKPEYKIVVKNEVIIRKGEKVTLEHLKILEYMYENIVTSNMLNRLIYILLIIVMSIILIFSFIKHFQKRIFITTKNIIIFSVVIVLMLGLSKICESKGLDFYYVFAVMGAMLVTILINSIAGILSVIVLTIYSITFCQNSMIIMNFIICGAITVLIVSKVIRRTDILKAGFLVGISSFVVIFSYELLNSANFTYKLFYNPGISLGIIFFSSVIVIGMLPLFENIFKITTNIKLLELSDINHPLLKLLADKAPGTYHHSLVVSRLAEAATEEVGGNPLLARVGAYYHDIGKINKPEYFIENQENIQGKHEKLSPNMSSLIIIGHVKDGLELAEKYKLGDDIINIIYEHHGTGLIYFFYKKAQENLEQGKKGLNEDEFRYPGHKPKTKESAIIMLADSVEAASRTLTDPTPSRIKGLVQRIINDKFIDSQLEECELTLKDLSIIENCFIKIVNGIFHMRVEYPEDKKV